MSKRMNPILQLIKSQKIDQNYYNDTLQFYLDFVEKTTTNV